MGKNLVVVAIPEEQDRVWKISSEKVPHLTLLFLGDADSNPHVEDIVLFVEHAVEICQHGPFYLDVDRRGTLGPDDADVVFFSTRSWNLKWIKQFRSQLLQNENIRTAYDSTDQYDEWQPHLTMGYPATPAKKLSDPFDDTIYSVHFDRIAVWVEDYDGPEFQLEWPDRDLEYSESALVYGDVGKSAVEDILEHHGVLGMKWGIRKDRAPSVVARPTNAFSGKQKAAVIAFGGFAFLNKDIRDAYDKNVISGTQYRQDKGWEKDFQKGKSFKFDDQKFTDEYNAKWESHDFSNEDWDNPSPTYKKYQDGYFKEMNTEYTKQVAAHYGTSPSGKYEAVHVPGTDMVKLRKKDTAQHADVELDLFRVKRDSKGFIVGLEEATNSMAQTVNLGKEFVAHQSVLDNPDLAAQIKAKLQSILDDITGDADKDINLFGDPIIRVKLQSVLQDFYKNPNVTEAMVYSALGELAMEHHGIKGMHWGIRRDRSGDGPQAVHPTATSKVPAGDRRKTKIKTEGGQNIDAHPDAIKVAEAKAKLKKSGPSALSNQELREVSSRVRLESEALLLTSHKGKQFVKRQLLGQGESVTRAGLREGTKRGVKKAGFAGAAAAL